MYNMVTVCNKSYQEFLIYFVNSLVKNCNLHNLNKLYVLNNGIDNDLMIRLSKKTDKLVFLNNKNCDNKITHRGWSKEWGYNVDVKTILLLDILEKDKLPSFLIDVDCFFFRNFESIIDFEKDVILCDRECDNHRMIGSFVYCNYTDNCLSFLKHWIYEQTLIKTYPKETLCLNKTYDKFKNKINIGCLSFKFINFYYTPNNKEELDNILIVHLKGAVKKDTFEEEIKNRINRLSSFVDINLFNNI